MSTCYSFIPTAQAARNQQIKRQQARSAAAALNAPTTIAATAATKSANNSSSSSSNANNSTNNNNISCGKNDPVEARRQAAVSPASLATTSSSSNSSSSLNQFNSLTPVSNASSTTTVASSTSSSSSTTPSAASANGQSFTRVSDNTRTDVSALATKLIDSISLRRQSTSAIAQSTTLSPLIMSPEQSQQVPRDRRLQERDLDEINATGYNSIKTTNTTETTTRTPSSSSSSSITNGSTQRIRRTTSPQLFHSYTLYSLEPKPLKPFKSRSDYLEAMKEDLAEWLNTLYTDLDLNADNFFSQLETGTIICRHANNVTQLGRNSMIATSTDQNTCGSIGAHSNTNLSNPQNSFIPKQHHANGATANTQNDDYCQMQQSIHHQNNSNISLLNSPSPDSGDHSIMSSYSSSNRSSCLPNSQLNHHYNNQPIYKQQHLNQSFISDCSSLPISSPLSLSPTPPNNRDINSSLLMRTNSSSSSSNNSSSHDNRSMINWYRVKMIPYKQNVRAGTFFARDNICQFILWCRSLNIHECLLFETDDLVARKNEKSFILCLLEVARIGCKVGMLPPLIIQLEQEIDKEIENDAKLQRQLELEVQEELELRDGADILDDDHQRNEKSENSSYNAEQGDHKEYCYTGDKSSSKLDDDNDSTDKRKVVAVTKKDATSAENGNEHETDGNEEFGPKPQVITNDLLTLHERVVQLLCQCTCATQFPMVRIGDGKYKVGDKMIIFVRILRRHIMVRVGGGWQEFSEFLRQKDPCRTKGQFGGSNQMETNGAQCNNGISNSVSPYTSGSTHYLNKYPLAHHNHHNNGHQRHPTSHRLISGSASMDWLSHNA